MKREKRKSERAEKAARGERTLDGSKVEIPKVTDSRKNILMFVHRGIHITCENLHIGVLLEQTLETFRARDEVDERDVGGGDTVINKDLDGRRAGTTSSQHRVKEHHVVLSDVLGELGVKELGSLVVGKCLMYTVCQSGEIGDELTREGNANLVLKKKGGEGKRGANKRERERDGNVPCQQMPRLSE